MKGEGRREKGDELTAEDAEDAESDAETTR